MRRPGSPTSPPSDSLPAGDVLARLHPAVRDWFVEQFVEPTEVQLRGWDTISRGDHTLLGAPTGSGKTLAAFLYSLSELTRQPLPDREHRLRVVYVSPLRALNYDIERNLVAPLTGIMRTAGRLGLEVPTIVTGVRTGDTSQSERRKQLKRGVDILITTPESLYVMLTTGARELFAGVQTIIVDEIHALASSKRGTHLALTLERLEEVAEGPIQRIGLSATQRPIERVAAFLGGVDRDVSIIEARNQKQYDVRVCVPVEDMTATSLVPALADLSELDAPGSNADSYSIWGALHNNILDEIEAHRSTIVFTNSRRLSERLATALNELSARRALHRALVLEAGGEVGRTPGGGHGLDIDDEARIAISSGESLEDEAPIQVARAHHGSISREARRDMEEQLKAGQLPAIIATSSLELGIDMGAVDLVLHVESPRSVASGIQRIGRAGHDVGAVSHARIFPKHRRDLIECAAVTKAVLAGEIEPVHIPELCLDVLSQQLIALGVDRDMSVTGAYELACRADPYRDLSRDQFDNLMSLLAGRYPVDDLADLRARVVVDDEAGTYRTRSDAARSAIMNAGTIPDRGLYGVFIAGGGPGRVGELDEEMVHETRLGDVIVLGASSWRVEEITRDRVMVTPVPGAIGKVPFWHGEAAGRTVSLGRAVGELVRFVASSRPAVEADGLAAPLEPAGDDAGLIAELRERWKLDQNAAHNLIRYIREQAAATGSLPSDECVVVERFRDELGDWRICILTPFGKAVHAPWAMAIEANLIDAYGLDITAMWSDDGIALRVPDTDTPIPLAGLVPDAAAVEDLVVGELARTALFAARFREIATRSLLLPLANFRKRSPLWLQRLKAHDVLQSAQQHSSFPMILETYRECLRDVFDMPELIDLLTKIADRRVAIVEVETRTASPFSSSLLFDYSANMLYDDDRPAAERRAQALSLDQNLLRELLGSDELRDLLDAEAIDEVVDELQHRAENRRARTVDHVHDMVRTLGDLTRAELVARVAPRPLKVGAADATVASAPDDLIDELITARRLVVVRIAGDDRYIAVEDTGTYLAALGTRLPPGVPQVLAESGSKAPLSRMVTRWASTHGPFRPRELADRWGIGEADVVRELEALQKASDILYGGFLPSGDRSSPEWCDPDVLRRIRRRTLARLRRQVEPIEQHQLARFLLGWHNMTSPPPGSVHVVREALLQLEGVEATPAAWERDLLPARIASFRRVWLDELMQSGQVTFVGTGSSSGEITGMLLMSEHVPLLAPELAQIDEEDTAVFAVQEALSHAGAVFLRDITAATGLSATEAIDALWRLSAMGRATNDAWSTIRAGVRGAGGTAGGGRANVATAPIVRRQSSMRRSARRGRIANPRTNSDVDARLGGRWSLVATERARHDERAAALADSLLDCFGVVCRPVARTRAIAGGFAAIYHELARQEELGGVRRGYFVEGLGGAQFAVADAVDRLRALRDAGPATGEQLVTLRANDPANPYGTILPWPEGQLGQTTPQRATSAYVILRGGELVAHLAPAGKRVILYAPDALPAVARELANLIRTRRVDRLAIESINGEPLASDQLAAFVGTGFVQTPRGVRATGSTVT